MWSESWDRGRCSAAKYSAEQESPGNGSGEVSQLFRGSLGMVQTLLCGQHTMVAARSVYPNRPREFTNSQEDDDPFTGGRRNTGDNVSPEASPRKRTRFIIGRPPASASAAATPTNTQLSSSQPNDLGLVLEH
ncbi:hypothetical protein E4U35_005640 [Claviceps purpurea]|nr:hypothetical protein E4U35_005640 [Claviceps purpurea]